MEAGFKEHGGLKGREDLVRRLLGSPVLVRGLEGIERDVAVDGYERAVKMLFLGAAGLAACMVFVQAGTGWKQGVESSKSEHGDGNGNVREDSHVQDGLLGVEDEEWEEGMEQGV